MSRPYQGRSPCGERGLKSSPRRLTPLTSASLPVRGAWIEIQVIVTPNAFCTSLPVRGAWIEIFIIRIASKNRFVAPRAGSVD